MSARIRPSGIVSRAAAAAIFGLLAMSAPASAAEYWGSGCGGGESVRSGVGKPCKTSDQPGDDVDVESTGVTTSVRIDKPKLPEYAREGATLQKSYDDFVGKR